MTSYTAFHSQLASIMEALTKAAVAEICELVDDSYAVLRLEVTRSHKENEALRRKLELIETIISRGRRGGVAMLELGGRAAAGAAPMGFAHGVASPAGAGAKQPKAHLRRSGRAPTLEAKTRLTPASPEDPSSAAAEEPGGRDVVLIKEEAAKEEVNGSDATDELLLGEDGTEVPPSDADDSEEGPSGTTTTMMMMSTSAADVRLWDPNGDGPPERLEPQQSHSAPGSPGPAGGAEGSSSDVVFDLAAESDCEAPSAVRSRCFMNCQTR